MTRATPPGCRWRSTTRASPRSGSPSSNGGICREVVYDAQTAARAGRRSTGHGLPAPNSYGPFPLNMVMTKGDATRDELIGGLDRGLLVTRFHYTNPVHPKLAIVTGMTRDGTFLVEGGRIVGPVRNLRFTQSYLDALAGVSAVGRELRTLRGFLGGVVVPDGPRSTAGRSPAPPSTEPLGARRSVRAARRSPSVATRPPPAAATRRRPRQPTLASRAARHARHPPAERCNGATRRRLAAPGAARSPSPLAPLASRPLTARRSPSSPIRRPLDTAHRSLASVATAPPARLLARRAALLSPRPMIRSCRECVR